MTQGLNPDLLHLRQILHHLSHRGSSGPTVSAGLMPAFIIWNSSNCCGFLTGLLAPSSSVSVFFLLPPRLQPVLSPPIPQSPREAGGGTTLASLPAAQLRGKAPESSRLSGLLLPFPLSIRPVLGSVLPLEPFRHILASWPLPFLAPTLLDMCILRLAPSLTFVASVGRSPSQ